MTEQDRYPLRAAPETMPGEVQTIAGGLRLRVSQEVDLEVRDVDSRDADSRATLAVHRGEAVLYRDRIRLASAKSRSQFLREVESRVGIVIPDESLLLLHQHADAQATAPDRPSVAVPPSEAIDAPRARYAESPEGLRLLQPGGVATLLTNFRVRITSQVTVDDGILQMQYLELLAMVGGRTQPILVPLTEFTGSNWPLRYLGPEAITYPGSTPHLRPAIQEVSGRPSSRTVFGHTGWREIDGTMVYLHGDGAIGPKGPISGVEVRLPPELSGFHLPHPPEGEQLREAIRASLRLWAVARPAAIVPLFASIPRALLGGASFGLFVCGLTQTGKTELGARIQQHFGAGMHAGRLAATWASTGNALEVLAFLVKDSILLVDDFPVTGSRAEAGRLNGVAERLFRAQGNRAGRQRLNQDLTLQQTRAPRGLVVSTGEDIPAGQSLRGRLLVVELAPGQVDWDLLSQCQIDGARGMYAGATAGFIRWLAARPSFQSDFAGMVECLRPDPSHTNVLPRTASIVAELSAALVLWLDFAEEVRALSSWEKNRLWNTAIDAFDEVGTAQLQYQEGSDPPSRFLTLLGAALASGRAHVATPEGSVPEDAPGSWGWRLSGNTWRPYGQRVGWVRGEDLFLELDVALSAVQFLGGTEPIPIGSKTLAKRLHERGLLASTEASRDRLTVRRTIEGRRREVHHILVSALSAAEPAQPARPSD